MKEDIIAIIARHLESAQTDHVFTMREVEDAQEKLDVKTALLMQAETALERIEDIHDSITED